MSIEKSASLERLIPELCSDTGVTERETLVLHLERYEFATRQGMPGRWLDCACGVGYGSYLIAQSRTDALAVVGVDISQDAINYANGHYMLPGKTEFYCEDACLFCRGQFDTIVSLETIEHVDCPETLVRHFVNDLLLPHGVLVASVPITPSVDANPFHKHDFSRRQFLRMLRNNDLIPFAELIQIQPFNPLKILKRTERRTESLRRNLFGYYLQHPACFVRRILSTLTCGFRNKYLTVACHRNAARVKGIGT